jgi:hypothetical protein
MTVLVWLRATLLVTLLAGLGCQAVQTTDPTPLLCYFTMDSAILQAAIMFMLLTRAVTRVEPSTAWAAARLTVVTGMVVSGVVYAAVIGPTSPSGGWWFNPADDPAVKTATTLIHGAATLLAIAEYVASGTSLPVRRAWLGLWWPGAYLAVMEVLSAAGLQTIPYPFLEPAVARWWTIASCVGLVVVVLAVAVGLLRAAAMECTRRPARTSTSRATP